MSIFAKPLSQLGTADLQELLQERAVENLRLEFKADVPDKDETLKKLSSFANTYGGLIVIGAAAASVDGRVEDLPGVSHQPGYKQKVVQWCFDAVSPPLFVDVSDPIPTPSGNGKFCYVIGIAESDLTPHFLNGRKGIWIRTNEFSGRFEAQLANETELRHLLHRRQIIQDRRNGILERAKGRFETYLAKGHTDRAGNRTKIGPLLTFCLVPRFPSEPLSQQENLKGYVQQNWTPWRGIMFTDPGAPILSQYESAIVLDATKRTSVFEVNVWGLLFYGTQISHNESGADGIHSYEFVGYILLFIRHACAAFGKLGYSGPILIETSLVSIKDVPWLHGMGPGMGRVLSSRPGSELDDEFAFSISTTTDELRQRPDRIALDVVRTVFFSVNRSEMVDSPEKAEELIRMGYEYNSWPRPNVLQT